MQSDDVKQEEHTVESELTSTPSNIDNIYMIIKKKIFNIRGRTCTWPGLKFGVTLLFLCQYIVLVIQLKFYKILWHKHQCKNINPDELDWYKKVNSDINWTVSGVFIHLSGIYCWMFLY